jgi:DNA helicase II / ATP-dependent DNA helicase PcrA
MHGLWQTNIPSRFLDELPEANVEVMESQGGFGGYAGYGSSRFDSATSFGSSYSTPGWQRAQANKSRGEFGQASGFSDAEADYDSNEDFLAARNRGAGQGAQRGGAAKPRLPLTIEGELVAKSTGTVSAFNVGDRVFHQKFGNGNVSAIDGNKLTIQFDRAGEKRVVDSFVERV